jgi:hypothetical protein
MRTGAKALTGRGGTVNAAAKLTTGQIRTMARQDGSHGKALSTDR